MTIPPPPTSFPFMRVARQCGVSYGLVLSYADAYAMNWNDLRMTPFQIEAWKQFYGTAIGNAIEAICKAEARRRVAVRMMEG